MHTQVHSDEMVNPVQLQKFLGGIDYPATKDVILETAEQHGADEMVLDTLSMIEDKEYASSTEVTAAVGELDEI